MAYQQRVVPAQLAMVKRANGTSAIQSKQTCTHILLDLPGKEVQLAAMVENAARQ